MSIKHIAVACLTIILASLAWKYRAIAVSALSSDSTKRTKSTIEFDNGSVRDTARTVTTNPKEQPAPVGVLRKCIGDGKVEYTNNYCPPGTSEAMLNNGTVNVVTESTRQKTVPEKVNQGTPTQTNGMSIHDKMIERALDPK